MTVPEISVRNLQRRTLVNIAELETFAANAVKRCLRLQKRKRTDLRKLREIFVWLISDRRMAHLHRKFLGQSGSTDAPTFQHGEIFISVDTAERHARAFGNSFIRELKLYIVHGLLHLHGFDDQTPSKAHRMKTAQEKFSDVHCHVDRSAAQSPNMISLAFPVGNEMEPEILRSAQDVNCVTSPGLLDLGLRQV